MTKVSLLIPCYNAARYLPRLWESVAGQLVPFDEIIFYDDASTDNTAEVIRGLPGVQLICGENNLGPAGARNELMRRASCEFIHFQDADDPMNPLFLQRLGSELGGNLDVVFCNADWLNESDGALAISWRYRDAEIQQDPLGYLLTHPTSLNNSLIRRELILKTGGFNTGLRIFEDADMYVRLAAAGGRFRVIEEVLTTSLRHDRGVSSSLAEIASNRLKALRHYASWMDRKYFPMLADQAEIAARKFYLVGDRNGLRQSLNFCIQVGGRPPRTNNRLMKALKSVLSHERAFILQESFRRIFFRLSRQSPSV